MYHVILRQPEGDRILSLRDYAALTAGLAADRWPAVHCIACGRPVYPAGARGAVDGFTPRFRHGGPRAGSEEACPLSAGTKRFRGLRGNPPEASRYVAAVRRAQFLLPGLFRESYLVCRQLCGGAGALSPAEFARMVAVADSRSLWFLSSLPPWSIPLLLMLMTNHTTTDGHSGYYWRFIKSTRPRDCNWDGREKYLSAFWLGSGYRVTDALPGGRATVPFTEAMVAALLAESLSGPQEMRQRWWTWKKSGISCGTGAPVFLNEMSVTFHPGYVPSGSRRTFA